MPVRNLKKCGYLKLKNPIIWIVQFFIWFDQKCCNEIEVLVWIIQYFFIRHLNWFCKNELNRKKSIWHKNSITETFSKVVFTQARKHYTLSLLPAVAIWKDGKISIEIASLSEIARSTSRVWTYLSIQLFPSSKNWKSLCNVVK